MFSCPRCQKPLTRLKTERGLLWTCDSCGGHAINLSLLRRTVDRKFVNTLWLRVRQSNHENPRNHLKCPSCVNPMDRVFVEGLSGQIELDACVACQFVWLDVFESGGLPILPPEAPKLEDKLAPEAREAVAIAKARSVADKYRAQHGADPPEIWWKMLATLFGFPAEEDAPLLQRIPIATWAVALLCLLTTLSCYRDLEAAIAAYGFIPSDPFQNFGLNIVISFFLHGGIVHLLGNLYFLLVFGDNIEDFIGYTRFLILLAAGAVAGDCLVIALDPNSTTPLAGASGGISAVITFYALKFPRVRLALCVRYWLYLRWLRPTAMWALALWIILQTLGAWQQWAGFSNISSIAHLGGCAAGFLAWRIWRKTPTLPPIEKELGHYHPHNHRATAPTNRATAQTNQSNFHKKTCTRI